MMQKLLKGDITTISECADGTWAQVAIAHTDGSISILAPESEQRITLNPGQARNLVQAWNELHEQRMSLGE